MPKYIEELVSRQVRKSEMSKMKDSNLSKDCKKSAVVTISRRMGSGAKIIAQKVADDLGWSIWSRELIDEIAQNADVSKRVVEAFDEKTISQLQLIAHSALGDHEMGSFMYPTHLARAIHSVAKLQHAIILGRGANFLLPDALHIRIDASDKKRIENMMKFENMTQDEAIKRLKTSDKERHLFVEKTYGKKAVQDFVYDLVINTDHITNDEAAAIIKTAILSWCGLQDEHGNLKTAI